MKIDCTTLNTQLDSHFDTFWVLITFEYCPNIVALKRHTL